MGRGRYPRPILVYEMCRDITKSRENPNAKNSFTALYQQQLIGTPVAVITSGVDLRIVIIMFQEEHVQATIANGLRTVPPLMMDQRFLRPCAASFSYTRFATRCGLSGRVAAGVPSVSATVSRFMV